MDLDGITVLDLTRLLPGPFATQLLADLGADVVKVEAPGTGDYARDLPPFTDDGVGTIFDAVNRGKRSVAIDLKTERGRALFGELAADADVVMEGFRPGVAERLGVDHESVRVQATDVVYCSLTGFGQTGPLADAIGHDLTYEGYSGLLDLTREGPSAAPQIPGFPVADMAGGLFAAFAVVGSLLSRELHGGGDYIDVSLTEVLTAFGQPLGIQRLESQPPAPGQTELTGGLPWYDVYEAADGEYVTLAALEPRFWRAFCEATGREDLKELHGTTDEAELTALRGELADLFETRTREEWLDALAGHEAAVGPVLSFDAALEHPQLVERGLVQKFEAEAPRIGFPALVGGERPAVTGPSPARGEHTEAVLTAAGVSRERVAELADAGVLEVNAPGG